MSWEIKKTQIKNLTSNFKDFLYNKKKGVLISVCFHPKKINCGLLVQSDVGFFVHVQKKGFVTVSEIKASLKWEKERACHVLVSVGSFQITALKHLIQY